MTDGLGPCPTPWCEPEHEKYTWQGPDDLFCVICDGCQVEGPHCEDEGDAQAAWNTRASLAAQDGGLISDKSRIERLRRLVHRWITQGQVRGVVHDMDLQCEIDDAFAWANGNGISAPAPSLAAQDGLVEALRKVRECALVVPSIFPDTPPSVSWIVSQLTKLLPEIDAALASLGDKP